jgi:hypothetical protein
VPQATRKRARRTRRGHFNQVLFIRELAVSFFQWVRRRK